MPIIITVNYSYNNIGLLKSVIGNKNYISDIQYNKNEQKTLITYGNGTEATFDYDSVMWRLRNYRLYGISNNSLMQKNYTYNNTGNIANLNSNYFVSGISINENYAYDADNRLEYAQGNNGRYYNLNMAYSPAGRIKDKNLQITPAANANVSPSTVNSYYHYNAPNNPYAVSSLSGTHSNDMYWDANGNLCYEVNQYEMKFFTWTEDNRLQGFYHYFHSDHLGSTSLITNLDGEVVQHIEYVPFGEVFIEERNNKWNTPYLFNAKELDEETGLYYYGARYYEPRVSLWLNADPSQEKYPGISTYAYCHNNPINRIDPDGCADYYALDGTHLGYDDVNDGRVFKVEGSTKFNINDFKDGGKYFNNQIGFNEINGKGYAVNEVSMESDLGLLARIGYAEFRGSNNTEQQVGMDITLNRVDDSKFPNTLQEVIEQPKQYSSLNANDPNKKYFDDPASTLVNSKGNLNETNHNAWVKSVSNAIQVLEGDKRGISQGAILYYSPRSMSPANSMPKWNFKLLQENTDQGVRTSHLRFFKYK